MNTNYTILICISTQTKHAFSYKLINRLGSCLNYDHFFEANTTTKDGQEYPNSGSHRQLQEESARSP